MSSAATLELLERNPPAPPAASPVARERTSAAPSAVEKRAEAAAWLSSLPTRTVFWSTDAARSRGWAAERLAMHRRSASAPEFWEKQWLVSPSESMTGRRLVRWYRDIFLRNLPHGERGGRDGGGGLIVEAGCGNGNVLRMCANEGLWMEGLDFAVAAVEANQRLDPRGRYRVGDVRALPYADGELGGYISLGVVEHFDEAERMTILREAARVLRPGGVALISAPHFNLARRVRARVGGYEQPNGATAAVDTGASDVDSSRTNGVEQAVPANHYGLEFYQYFLRSREITAQIEHAGLRVTEVDGYDVRYGLSSTLGGEWGAGLKRSCAWLASRSKWWARRVDHPPKLLRRLGAHMMMVVAQKPQ